MATLRLPTGAEAKIIVRIDHTALMRGCTVDGATCEIAGIGPVPIATVREWMDDAFVAAVLTKGDPAGAVLLVPPGGRRSVWHADVDVVEPPILNVGRSDPTPTGQ